MIKIDLLKAYDQVSWLYIRLLLTHLGLRVPFINRVMSCISIVSFVVLINETVSHFFHSKRGLINGCPLSPLLFLLAVEELSRAIEDAKSKGEFQGI
jgi:hypothetical protein